MENGFKINKYDKCVYVIDIENDYVILCFYDDDMLISGSNDTMIKFAKSMLNLRFDIKDLV